MDRVVIISINGESLIQLLDKNHDIGYTIMRNLTGIINKRLTYITIAFRHQIRRMREKLRTPVG